MTLWVYWLCVTLATIGVGLLIHAVFSKEILGPLVLLSARDDLSNGIVVLPLGGRILSNFCYPAAVLGPVVGLLSRTWKGYLLMALPLVILLGLSLVSGGRGPLLIGFCLTGWVVLASDSSDRSRIKAKKALVVAACITVFYFMLIAELRSNMKAGSGLSGVTTYLRTPIPAFSAWLETASPPMINMNLSYLAPIREVLVRSGGKQLRDVDSFVVYVPYPYNVFTALAEHCISFGLVGMVFVWFCIGGGIAFLESSGTIPYRAAIMSVGYTYLTYSLVCDLAFLVTGWLLSVALVAGLVLFARNRSQRENTFTVIEAGRARG
jgi:oligosaccharide repeat unit polymerase